MMISSRRVHALCYGYLFLLGLVDLIGSFEAGATTTRVTFGLLYVLVALCQLFKRSDSAAPVLALQYMD
jgi:hypothetical protein